MSFDLTGAVEKVISEVKPGQPVGTSTLWAKTGTFPPRPGNDVKIFIDGQSAYKEIAADFHRAKKFIYATISYGQLEFLPVPENGETMFDLFRSRRKEGVDVRLVIWNPAQKTADTIPDPAPATIPGLNDGADSIQARWDVPKGYCGDYRSPRSHFEPFFVDFPAILGCHHQKTYIMDDGADGVIAFVGGINPVQAYWDTPAHDCLNPGRVARGINLLQGLESTPPLHDIFYQIDGPAVGDILANFVERFNGASIPYQNLTADVTSPVTAADIPRVPNGIEVQVIRTIAPKTYPGTPDGDRGIRELYFNALGAAGQGDLIYIENQYFFDHGIISEIHEAAERGAKVVALLSWRPDEGTAIGKVECELEKLGHFEDASNLVKGHRNVLILTLGNSCPDPRAAGKVIYSETYIHSKTLAVLGREWGLMTGGSANIAFTSMWFHSEMNIAFADTTRVKNWVAQLWSEHLNVPLEKTLELIGSPDDAFTFFQQQAIRNKAAFEGGVGAEGNIFDRESTNFPPRQLSGITLPSPSAERDG